MPEATPNQDKSVNMGELNLNVTDPDKAGTNKVAPETAKIEVAGKSFDVPKEVADALTAAQQAGVETAGLKTQVSELAALLESMKPKNKVKEGGEMDMATLLFAEPEKAIQKVTDEILNRVEGRLAQTEAQREFWSEFYRQNKDLSDVDAYVRFVFQRDYPAMAREKITQGEAMKRVAAAVKADLLKLRGGAKPGKKSSAEMVEGGDEGTPTSETRQSDSEDLQTVSTASILNERRAARKAAQKPGKK